MKILFFLESLSCGGQERRSLELMRYLKKTFDYEIELVLTEEEIYYEEIYELGIKIIVLKRVGFKYDPSLLFKFYRICRRFKPDIIHSWGKMTTFYAIPSKLICRIPIVSSLISNSYRNFGSFSRYNFLLKTNVHFSDVILSNSMAGLIAYRILTPKAKVIYNGVNLERFRQNFDIKKIRDELGITAEYVVVMVASFSDAKDYDLFINTAKEIRRIRNDVTFVGVGDGPKWERIQQRICQEQLTNIILTGKRQDIEPIVAASDIGILCTYSEGISNSIIEYMALGKPVISTDVTGGSKEIILEGATGYCTERKTENVVTLVNLLLNNKELSNSMGNMGKSRIFSHFSIDRMSEEFENVYKEVLGRKKVIGRS